MVSRVSSSSAATRATRRQSARQPFKQIPATQNERRGFTTHTRTHKQLTLPLRHYDHYSNQSRHWLRNAHKESRFFVFLSALSERIVCCRRSEWIAAFTRVQSVLCDFFLSLSLLSRLLGLFSTTTVTLYMRIFSRQRLFVRHQPSETMRQY